MREHRYPIYQDLPYTPEQPRTLSEIVIDYFLPPVLRSDGCRYDESYWERVCFHFWDLGGPNAPRDEVLPISPLERWRAYRTALSERWTQQAQARRLQSRLRKERLHARRYRIIARCFRLFGMKKIAREMAVRAKWHQLLQFDEDGLPDPSSPRYYENDTYPGYDYDQPPLLQAETTPLLQSSTPGPTSHYSEWSLFYIVSQQETVLEQDYPRLSSPSSSPRGTKRPSALANKNEARRSFSLGNRRYSRPKTVRFSGVHKIMLYDKPPWEPTGCLKPNYHNSALHTIVSFFRSASSRPTPSGYQPLPATEDERRIALAV